MCNALRHTVQLCEVLANQMAHVNNTYCVRIALIQHLVTSVMPLPLPAYQEGGGAISCMTHAVHTRPPGLIGGLMP